MSILLSDLLQLILLQIKETVAATLKTLAEI